jgi:hypothetical protein
MPGARLLPANTSVNALVVQSASSRPISAATSRAVATRRGDATGVGATWL